MALRLHSLPLIVLLNLFLSLQSGIVCILVDALIKLEIYSNYVQVCIAFLLSGHSYHH